MESLINSGKTAIDVVLRRRQPASASVQYDKVPVSTGYPSGKRRDLQQSELFRALPSRFRRVVADERADTGVGKYLQQHGMHYPPVHNV